MSFQGNTIAFYLQSINRALELRISPFACEPFLISMYDKLKLQA